MFLKPYRLESVFKLNKLKEGDNLGALKNLFPAISHKESPDDEPSVNHDHLDADVIKPSRAGTRSRENTRRNSRADKKNNEELNDTENYSPSRTEGSPTREGLLKNQGNSELKFFLSPIVGQNSSLFSPQSGKSGAEKDAEQTEKEGQSPAQRRTSIHKQHVISFLFLIFILF